MSESEIPYEKHLRDQEPMQQDKIHHPSDINPEPPTPIAEGSKSSTHKGGEGGKFKCSICGKIFNSKAELDMHIKSQHAQKAK